METIKKKNNSLGGLSLIIHVGTLVIAKLPYHPVTTGNAYVMPGLVHLVQLFPLHGKALQVDLFVVGQILVISRQAFVQTFIGTLQTPGGGVHARV